MYSINKKVPGSIRKYYINPVAEGLVLASIALFLTAITSFFIYHHALSAIKAEIRDGLFRTASGIAACIDGDLIASFDAPEKKDLPEYLATVKLLQKARLATKHCTYLYINRMEAGSVVFIVDPTPIDEQGKPLFVDEKNLEASVPMTKYDSPSQELLDALASQTSVVSAEPYTDSWGTFYSAYVPIFDANKRFVGTLGADLRINDMLARCKPIEDATKRAFFVSCALSLLCGTLIWFTRRFSLQLNESRFFLLNNLHAAKEFADQSSISIGKQLNKTARLMQNVAKRMQDLSALPAAEISEKLVQEQNRLSSLSEKLLAVGELKCGKGVAELQEFRIIDIVDAIKASLQQHCATKESLLINLDEKIPPELYGSVRTYQELLEQTGIFFLKMFHGPVNCQLTLANEGNKDVVLRQFMSADISGRKPEELELLRMLCDKGKKSDFFSEIELAEATAVPIIRELIYLLNSDIDLKIEADKFIIFFEAMFQKAPESMEEENE